MLKSQHSIIKEMYNTTMELSSEQQPQRSSSSSSKNNSNNLKLTDTVASQFRSSLRKLMHILFAKEPSYIRCIKPNYDKSPALFDAELVRHQVKYLGLLENLRVRRAGYAYKKPFALFLDKYKCLCEQTWPVWRGGEARKGVATLLASLNFTEGVEYALGISKLFIRSSKTFFELEDKLDRRKAYLASVIKALYKGYRQRIAYRKMIRAAFVISLAVKRWLARKYFQKRIKAKLVLKK